MGKYSVGEYSSNIKMEAFYEFLCCDPSDDMETIRKMYNYYRTFSDSYDYIINEYGVDYVYEYKKKKVDGWDARQFLEKEHSKHELMIRLTHDSYLAILLHRLDYENYRKIIKGLYGYFECYREINPPLKGTNYKTKEYMLTKEQYIRKLIDLQNSSTSAGAYLYTSSVGSIIEIEKEIIKPDEKIKCLRLDQEVPYGSINI